MSNRDFAEVLRENFEAKNTLENAQNELRRLRDRCARLKRQRDWLRLNANRYEPSTAKLGLPKP